jgi:hypothetical protein
MSVNKLSSPGLEIRLEDHGRTPLARLSGLARLFRDWGNKASADDAGTETGAGMWQQLATLSISDIDALKSIIVSEVKKTAVPNADIVSDQILFLLLGAIQLHSRGNADKAWDLVQDSISEFLKPKTSFKPLLFAGMTLLLISVASSGFFYLKSTSQANTPLEGAAVVQPGELPASITALQDVYTQMKGGKCQLPQAGMLPPDQRQAYIAFINDGIVDLHSADALQKALTHVSCDYPQKLMMSPK